MKKKILIIDDSRFMRAIIKNLLIKHEYEVIEAQNGQEALDLYEQISPDAVTLDLTMPDMDGIDVLKQIHVKDEKAIVLICSSMVYQGNIDEAMENGAKEFIKKPFQDQAFLSLIEKHIKKE